MIPTCGEEEEEEEVSKVTFRNKPVACGLSMQQSPGEALPKSTFCTK
jgi:hypothetical protein